MSSEEHPTSSASVARRLAAILSADVKGYSRLMGDDEIATVRTLTAHRAVMAALIQQHRGRVVDSPGDNMLAEFASVVDALEGAVHIQQELKTRNSNLPPTRRMEFRIGINLGDVIVEEERIYGDGVNIAARLENLADAGGICISGTVYDQVETKLAFRYEFLGEQPVKNIAKPVRVYRVLMEEATSRGKAPPQDAGLLLSEKHQSLPLPDKPSIAVLPFVNMSSDPEQEYFSDGITEDLITDLSKISGLFVISRNSVLPYKGKAIKPEQVSVELGVRYILEGSIRKAGNRVRITAQLIDAATGYHLWAERYDRDLQDIFALQDEVTRNIVASLKVQLTVGEQQRLGCPLTKNLEAYDCYLRGLELYDRSTQEANLLARQLFVKAVALDPRFATAHAHVGWAHFAEWSMGWSQDPRTLDLALASVQKALAVDALLPTGHRLLGIVYLWKKQYDLAIAEVERALALDQNDADTYCALGDIFNFSGRPEETPDLVEKAMRLNPHYPTWYLWVLGHAYYLLRRYDEAIATFKKALTRNPDFLPAHGFLAIIYGETGSLEEAKVEGATTIRLSPQFSHHTLQQRMPYKDPAVLERVLHGARRARLQ
ncbi:MAG TPA: adenylate/guanylate cyclase domain-containing protein [Methylomirabilota bacterium]|nr:adenylate/guanylate cyclase domain-containing protein [Methylomirabilota bacterium]